MTIRKTVTLIEEIHSEYGAPATPPLRRIAIAAVFDNPLAGASAGADASSVSIVTVADDRRARLFLRPMHRRAGNRILRT